MRVQIAAALIALGIFLAGCTLFEHSKISPSDVELLNFSQSSCADTMAMDVYFSVIENSFDSSQNISTVKLKVNENCGASLVGNLSAKNNVLYLSSTVKPSNIKAACGCDFIITYQIRLKNGATNPKMRFGEYDIN